MLKSHDNEGESDVPSVCIFGAALDVGNRGVLALGVSLAHLVARTLPAVPLTFFYGNAAGGVRRIEIGEREIGVQIRNCRMSPSSAPSQHVLIILLLTALYRLGIKGPARRNPWLSSLLSARFIGDIRGGDSFSDIYGLRRFVEGSLPLLTVAVLGRPYVLLPQTYGPFRSATARLLAKSLLRRAQQIYTRDRRCQDVVTELCGRTATFCPDVAFTMDVSAPSRLTILPEPPTSNEAAPVIGLNISGLLYKGGYNGRNMFGLKSEYRRLVHELIERLLSATNARILLVPHEFGPERGGEGEEDASAAVFEAFRTKFAGRMYLLSTPLSERELKGLIGRVDFFVGSRMHACIAAISQAVPAVGLAYSDKFLGVFQSAGVGEAIVDLRSDDQDSVTNQVIAAFESRAIFRAELEKRIPIVRAEIERTFARLLTQSSANADPVGAPDRLPA